MHSHSLLFLSLYSCMASGHTKNAPSRLFLEDKKIFIFLIIDFLRSHGNQYPSASQILKQMQPMYAFGDEKQTLLWRIVEIFLIFCPFGVLRNIEKVPLLCERPSLLPGQFGSNSWWSDLSVVWVFWIFLLSRYSGSLFFGWELLFDFLWQFPPVLTHTALLP